MSEEKRQLRKDVYLQVLNEIQNIQGEKRKRILETLDSAITIPDLELMTMQEVELCATYLPDVRLIEVFPEKDLIEAGFMEDSHLTPEEREFL